MKKVTDGSTGENTFVSARSEIIPATHFPVENKWLCHVIPGSKLRVEGMASQTQVIRRFCQVDSQPSHQQCLGTLRECFQLVSEREREGG